MRLLILSTIIWVGLVELAVSETARLIKWHFKKDMSLNLMKHETITFHQNGVLIETVKQNNIINLVAQKVKSNTASFRGFFKTFTLGENEVLILKDVFFSHFDMTSTGRYIVSPKEIQPTVRSIPTFPEKKIKPGDTWKAECSYFCYQFNPAFLLITNAYYTYLSNAHLSNTHTNEKEIAVIKIEYEFMEDVKRQLKTTKPRQVAYITAKNTSILHWDINANVPAFQTDHLHEIITLNNGYKWRWEMRFNSKYDVTYPLEEKTLSNIQEKIKNTLSNDLSNETIQSYVDERGLHLVLGKIFFDHDSHVLTSPAQVLLNKILPILNEYSSYEILIEGHTDNTGTKQYNQKLSLIRAKNVANYLKQNGSIQHQKLYITGHGENQPLFNNDTKVHHQKNRRVEIILKQSGQ